MFQFLPFMQQFKIQQVCECFAVLSDKQHLSCDDWIQWIVWMVKGQIIRIDL